MGIHLTYSWDEEKNELNKRKHGVSFETAQFVFDDLMQFSRIDRIVDGEERWQTFGRVGESTLLLVAHTWNDDGGTESIRIISARRATKAERKIYENLLKSVLKELARLAGKSDCDIDLTDIPVTTAQDWVGGVRGRFYRPTKQQLSLRIDKDILEWIKGDQPKGYHSRINGILRSAMLSSLSGVSRRSSAAHAEAAEKAEVTLMDRVTLPGKQGSISTRAGIRAKQQPCGTTTGEPICGKKRRYRESQGKSRVTIQAPVKSRET